MVFETLYKTNVPEELFRAEYYQPHLAVERVNGKPVYFVREKHGWYDDALDKPHHHITTLNPDEGFSTFEEAEARYNQQIQHRASEGFVHSFWVDQSVIPPLQRYRRIA